MVSAVKTKLIRPQQSLERILLEKLATAIPGRIPGCDGMTTHRMLHEYAQLAADGLVPGCRQLLRLYPQFAPQLETFFSSGATHQSLDGCRFAPF